MTSHPSRAGSHGTGWPRWSPCQSQLKRRRRPQQPGHQQSYEDCLPQLPSQPAGEPLVLGTQRGACVVTAHPQTVTIHLSCQATNWKSASHSSELCSSHWGSSLWCEGRLVSARSGEASVHSKSSTGPFGVQIVNDSTDKQTFITFRFNLRSEKWRIHQNRIFLYNKSGCKIGPRL